MKAVVFHGIGDIRIDDVPEPKIQDPFDAIVKITTSAICGTDLHFIRGSVSGVNKGTVLGHEGIGIVEEVGKNVRNFKPGDRVIIPSTIGCGYCSYCRAGYFAQCDNANPNGPRAGTAFYGGPKDNGGFNGMQAEYVRVPYANINLVLLPNEVTDEKAILLSDIFPTGYFGADNAEITAGDTVAVFGCGPVGQFSIASSFLKDAGRVIAIDGKPQRLEMARKQGAEAINFEEENVSDIILELTGGIGVDRVIDAVGVDAEHPHNGNSKNIKQLEKEKEKIVDEENPDEENWHPGDAPTQVLNWAVQSLAKAGTLSIIGVYPPNLNSFPIGQAMNMNLTMKMGNCNHRAYIPQLLELVRQQGFDPEKILTHQTELVSAIDAYKHFDKRDYGWIKVSLDV